MSHWTVETYPKYPTRAWYRLRWAGPNPSPLSINGWTICSFKHRRDAEAHAAVMNAAARKRACRDIPDDESRAYGPAGAPPSDRDNYRS